MTWERASGSVSSCIDSLELVKDLDTEPLLMQEPLESDHCEILVGSHIGVLVQLPAVLLARLSAEVLMKLPMKLPSQVHGEQALADLHSTLEVRVYSGMPVAGSVEGPGLFEGLAEAVPEGLVEVVHVGLPEVVPEGLVEVVHAGLLEVVSEGLVEVLVELVPAGLPEVVPEGLVEVLVELVSAGLVLVWSVGDSGLPESLLAPGSLAPSYICLVDPWDLGLSTSLIVRLQLRYIALSGFCLSRSVAESLGSSFCLPASEFLHQLR